MPNSPVIYGPNNTATNLQNQFLNANGSVLGYNGPKNYISNGSFENGTFTGWTLGAVTLSGVYPSGSAPIGGAIGTMSLGVTTSSPLSGTTSLSLSTTGNMAAQTCFFTNSLPIDAEDKAKVLTFKFSYSVISGAAGLNFSGTSTNSFAVAVYDATNSIYLGTAGQFNLTQNSGVGVCTGTFQTGSTTANIQFVVYCPNTTVAATPFTVNFDNFFVGPQTSPMAPAISDWLSYTPTITGFGTVTAVNFVSRRVGGNLEVKGAFAAGTNTATQAQITVGYQGGNANVVVDTTKTPASTIAGMGTINAAASNYFGLYVLVPSANQSYVNLGLQQTTTTAQTPINGNAVSGTGALIQVQFTVPIVGFSSNSSASSDTDTRVIAFTGTSASTAVSATVAATLTATNDTAGGWNGTTYTVPVSGQYVATGGALCSVANALTVWVNGALYGYFASAYAASSASGGSLPLGYLNAGATIQLRAFSAITATTVVFGVERLCGPAVVTATESVNARYYGSSSAVSGTLATVAFSTKAWDTHSAYNTSTGFYTVPVSGKYQVNCSIASSATLILNSTLDIQMQQTGSGTQISEQTVYAGGAQTAIDGTIGDIFYCLAGDVIKVQVSNSGTSPALVASTSKNWFSIARVGN